MLGASAIAAAKNADASAVKNVIVWGNGAVDVRAPPSADTRAKTQMSWHEHSSANRWEQPKPSPPTLGCNSSRQARAPHQPRHLSPAIP
eukprot:2471233-Pleurochrysis_carterae.AAC.1